MRLRLVAVESLGCLLAAVSGLSCSELQVPRLARTTAPLEISPEYPFDTVQYSELEGVASSMSSASSGSVHFVVWVDRRSTSSPVLGVRVGPAGEVLDSPPLVISGSQALHSELVDVTFDGADFTVTWSTAWAELRARRVRADGTFVESDAVTLHSPPIATRVLGPRVAFNGTQHLVVWVDDQLGSWRLRSMLLSRDLVPAGAAQPIFTTAMEQEQPDVEAGAGAFLVAWAEGGCVKAAKVDELGAAGTATSVSCAGTGRPRVTYGAGQFLVAWSDRRNGTLSSPGVFASRITSAGAVLDLYGFSVVQPDGQSQPSAAFDGTNYVIAYEGSGRVRATRVNPVGNVLDSSPLQVSNSMTQSAFAHTLTFGFGRHLVAWREGGPSQSTLQAVRIEPSGNRLDNQPLHLGLLANRQFAPQVASSGVNFFAVWEDNRNHGAIYGARYSLDGGILDPAPILLSEPVLVPYAVGWRGPSVVFDGRQYVVGFGGSLYGTETRIYLRRVGVHGGFIDSTPVLVSSTTAAETYRNHLYPRMASSGSSVLVGWTASDYLGSRIGINPKVQLVEVNTKVTGVVVLSRAQISGPAQAPEIAAVGQDYLLAWERPEEDGGIDVFSLPFALVRSATPPPPSLLSNGVRGAHMAALASRGTESLILWSEQGSAPGVYGSMVRADGTARLPPFLVADAPARKPTAVFDGAQYAVAWETANPDASWDIVVAHLDSDGGGLSDGGAYVALSASDELTPDLALGAGVVSLVYSRFDARTFVNTDRVQFRLLESGDAGSLLPDGGPPVDAGEDAGGGDGGARDAGPPDAGLDGSPDSGFQTDAGLDGSTPDSGFDDAG